MARWDRERTETTVPDWFWKAVETPSEAHSVEVDECDVVYQTWPADAGKPAMLLIHGMNAHRRWWDFIAPQLTDDFRIAAMDLTGMAIPTIATATTPKPMRRKSSPCATTPASTTT